MAVNRQFDPGPPSALAAHFADLPSYAKHRSLFWYDWGPVFYRGRLNKKVKLLGIASDPGPSERIAGRTLVGDAGQRVQGFLAKLGLTRSYVLVNAFAYALFPSRAEDALPILAEVEHRNWRNHYYDNVVGDDLQAIVAFGSIAKRAIQHWNTKPDVHTLTVPHPSSRDPKRLVEEWAAAITRLRAVVTPDPGGDATGANYGTRFQERDYAPIPAADLPFGLPPWFGDDGWGRRSKPRHNNCVERPRAESRHTLIWRAPTDQP